MEREQSRNTRNEQSNDKRSQADAASFPGRPSRKGKASFNQEWTRESIAFLRHMNTSRLNDLYERGSL